jgi:hypothetical protein
MDQVKGVSAPVAAPVALGRKPDTSPTVQEWLERFITLDNNPRSARIMGEGAPYSVNTIGLYSGKYNRYIKDDPLLTLTMAQVDYDVILNFMGRLGLKESELSHGGGTICRSSTW